MLSAELEREDSAGHPATRPATGSSREAPGQGVGAVFCVAREGEREGWVFRWLLGGGEGEEDPVSVFEAVGQRQQTTTGRWRTTPGRTTTRGTSDDDEDDEDDEDGKEGRGWR